MLCHRNPVNGHHSPSEIVCHVHQVRARHGRKMSVLRTVSTNSDATVILSDKFTHVALNHFFRAVDESNSGKYITFDVYYFKYLSDRGYITTVTEITRVMSA